MKKDWLFSADEYICDLRTVAVLVKDNKVLVQRDRNGNEYALPGGHIKIGETLKTVLLFITLYGFLEYTSYRIIYHVKFDNVKWIISDID